MSDKPYEATPRRLREAREKGELARSAALVGAVPVLAGVGASVLLAPPAWSRLRALTSSLLTSPQPEPLAAASAAARLLLEWSVIPLAVTAGAALLTGACLAGLEVRAALAAPDLARAHPGRGLQRVFHPRQLALLPRLAVAGALVAGVAALELRSHSGALLASVASGGVGAGLASLALLKGLALKGAAALTVAAVIDQLWARWRHRRRLRMGREELRRELKEQEGEPHLKAQRRARHRELLSGGPWQGVRVATALVVNPTHLAVALRYAPGETDAPYLVAKGTGAEAARLRAQATRLRIPVIRDIPLARSLFPLEVGTVIPEELYQAAAAVLKVALSGPGPDRSP